MRYAEPMTMHDSITHRHELVADNVRAELARKKLSGRDAAKALSLGQLYVARRLNGSVEMSVNDVMAFADLLNVDISVLFEGTKNAPTPKGGGNKLPELDSNQQPAGIKPGEVVMFPNMTEIHPENEGETDAEIIPMFA